MKVGFTGTRKGMTNKQKEVFQKNINPNDELHLGDCIGSDEDAYHLHKGRKVGHPPIDKRFRAFLEYDEEREPKPFLERNHIMVDETEKMLSTPKGFKEVLRSGTWSTVRYARKVGKQVIIILPDGKEK